MAAAAVTSGPQSSALTAALADLKVADRDGAAVQLARRYAELLDAPGIPAKYRDPLLHLAAAVKAARISGFDSEHAETALEKIQIALSDQTVASDLGPKYLAALTALGMTPAGRGVKLPTPNDDKPKGKADELSKRREDRERRRAEGSG